MRKIVSRVKKNRKSILMIVLIGVLFGIVPAHAQSIFSLSGFTNTVLAGLVSFLAWILAGLVQTLGAFLSVLVDILRGVLTYTDFSGNKEVIIGWKIVRDTVNIFYIGVLIAIAISTIIRWKPLDFRAALPRLILSAILVNFSRTLALFGIEVSNVLMTTFSTQAAQALPAFLLGLRAPAVVALSPETLGVAGEQPTIKADSSGANILLSIILAAIMLLMSLAGIAMFILVLLTRIVLLWVLIILSPLALFLWGIPPAQSYYQRWKTEFFKQLMVGPVMAFFIYIIVLFFVNNFASSASQKAPYGVSIGAASGKSALPTQITQPGMFFSYMLALVLMFVALEVTRELGGRNFQAISGVKKGIQKGIRGGRAIGRGISTALTPVKYGARVAGLELEKRGYASWTGIPRAISAIREAPEKRIKELEEDAQNERAKQSRAQAQAGNKTRAIIASLMGGNSDELARVGIGGALLEAGKGGVGAVQRKLGRGGLSARTTEELQGTYGQYEALESAGNAISNLNLATDDLNNLNLSQLPEAVAQAEGDAQLYDQEAAAYDQQVADALGEAGSIEALQSQRTSLQDELQPLQQNLQEYQALQQREAAGETLTDAEINRFNDLETAIGGGAGAANTRISDINAEVQAITDNIAQAQDAQNTASTSRQLASEARSRASNLQQLGEQVVAATQNGGVAISNDTVVRDAISQIGETMQANESQKQEVFNELTDRVTAGERLAEQVDQKIRKRKGEIADQLFDKDREKGGPTAKELIDLAKSSMNKTSDQKFTVIMEKAADTGNLREVMVALGHDTTPQGMASFISEISGEVEGKEAVMDKERALRMVQSFESRSLSEGKVLDIGFVERKGGPAGGYERISDPAKRTAAIKKAFKSKLETIMKKGGAEALGRKNTSGEWEMDANAIAGLKGVIGEYERLIEKGNITQSQDQYKMILKAAQEGQITLKQGTVRELQDRIRSG